MSYDIATRASKKAKTVRDRKIRDDKQANRWSRPAYPVRGKINDIKDAENGSRVLQVLVTEVMHRVHGGVERLTRSTPVNVMVASRKNRRCDVRREVFL